MLQLKIENARLPAASGLGSAPLSVAVRNGRIAEIAPAIEGEAERVIDARGRLLSPPFCDPHFHMDATLSLGLPRLNVSGTLLEGIALWGELKPLLTPEAVAERALRYCDLAVAQGLLAIRTHVDVCDDRLTAVEALLEVRKQVAPYIDLQLVAFPQDGLYRDPTARANLLRALDMGVDVVGGIPHFERTMADGAASVRELAELAANRGLMLDLHCDESDDPMSRHVETLAAETLRCGLQGRAAGSHLSSMHSMDNYYASKLIPLIAEAQLHAIPNPLINITLQGRSDTYPRRRGLTRIPELRAAGVNVALGQDCTMDPWYPLGSGDMLDVAHMAVHADDLARGDGLDPHGCDGQQPPRHGPARSDPAQGRARRHGPPPGAGRDRGRPPARHPPRGGQGRPDRRADARARRRPLPPRPRGPGRPRRLRAGRRGLRAEGGGLGAEAGGKAASRVLRRRGIRLLTVA